MSTFDNVSINKAANIYFDGNVSSRTVNFPNGEMKTLGIMLPGVYTFNTGKAELMEIQVGDVQVLLPGGDDWQHIAEGGSFEVPANSAFTIKVAGVTDYICSFLDN